MLRREFAVGHETPHAAHQGDKVHGRWATMVQQGEARFSRFKVEDRGGFGQSDQHSEINEDHEHVGMAGHAGKKQ